MRSGDGLAVLALLVGCYHPAAQPGVPCSADLECPGDQICDQRLVPPTCVDTLAAEVDASIDAPPPCVLDSDCPYPEAPICSTDGTCRGCIADSECASDVCHELAGTCVDEAAALYVAAGATGVICTRTDPCGAIDGALQIRTTTRFTIKVADGSYPAGFEVLGAVIGAGSMGVVISGEDRSWDGAVITATQRENRVGDGFSAVIEGLTLRDGVGSGVFARGATTISRCLITGSNRYGIEGRGPPVRVLDSRIEGNGNGGIDLENSPSVEVQRTIVTGHAGPGINLRNSGFTIVNTVVANNGTLATNNGGVRLDGVSGQPAVFHHNTIVNNRSSGANASGVQCDQAFTLENSIFATSGGQLIPILSQACSPRHSLFAANAPQGMGNKQGAPMFASATDFHILPGSAAIDAADEAVGETLDLDGQPRPNGTKPDCGADELY